MDVKFPVGLSWFEGMIQWIKDSEIHPGSPCKARVGMRTNTQRLGDPLGSPCRLSGLG